MTKENQVEVNRPNPLRVLMVEDLEDDVLFTIRELKKGKYNTVYERVETAAAMKKALQEKQWDIIICDYQMPEFDAPSAIAVLKDANIDIPLIIVSGAIGEETAVECMRLGAQDYIMKGNLSRLCPAIARELEDADIRNKQKKAEKALISSEEKFRKAFYTSPDAVNINRLEDGIYISINPAFTRITGYTEADIIGKSSIENNIWDNSEDRQRLLARLKKDGEVTNIEAAFRTKSGDIRYGLMSATVIDLDGAGHILSMTRDITDRKRDEAALRESENKYRLLADHVNDVIFVLDMNLNYTYISPSVKFLRGYEPEEVLKQKAMDTLAPSSIDLAMKTLTEFMALEKSEQSEIPLSRTLQLEMRRKDGTTVWTEVNLSFIGNENQQPIGILGVTRDITDRRRSEEELQQTLDNLRKAVNATIKVMVSAVEMRDPYTAGHQIRSADIARAIASEMGLDQNKIDGIRMAGSIHDIGKLSIPAEILSKPAKLTNIEFSLIKQHSLNGYEMLKNVESPWPLAQIVYQHHERMDGSGYPRNLKGNEIILEARIMAVADVVEAMASHRPYRPALGIAAAIGEIEKNKGFLYDHDVAYACLRLFHEKNYTLVS
jgi:PAS domain S-box-containing protein